MEEILKEITKIDISKMVRISFIIFLKRGDSSKLKAREYEANHSTLNKHTGFNKKVCNDQVFREMYF